MKQVILSAILSVAVLFTAPAAVAQTQSIDQDKLVRAAATGFVALINMDLGAAQVQMPDYCNPDTEDNVFMEAGIHGFRGVSCEDTAIGYTASFRISPQTRTMHESNKEHDDLHSPFYHGPLLGYTWVPDAFAIRGEFNDDSRVRSRHWEEFEGNAEFHSAHATFLFHVDIADALNVDIYPRIGLVGRAGAHYSKLNATSTDSRLGQGFSRGWDHGYLYGAGLQIGVFHFGWERRNSDGLGDVDVISASINLDIQEGFDALKEMEEETESEES